MKSFKLLLLFIIFSTVSFSGCMFEAVHGSGESVTTKYDFKDFTKMSIGYGCETVIEKGSSYSVEVVVNQNLKEYLDVYQKGDEVVIRLKGMKNYNNLNFKAIITMPEIDALSLSGGSKVNLKGDFSTSSNLDLALSGGSELYGHLKSNNTDMALSGGSKLKLSGGAEKLEVSASGGSYLDLSGYPVKTCNIGASGGSEFKVDVSERLSVAASGGSVVRYKGDPKLGDISLSGGSEVKRM